MDSGSRCQPLPYAPPRTTSNSPGDPTDSHRLEHTLVPLDARVEQIGYDLPRAARQRAADRPEPHRTPDAAGGRQ